ncbi:MAG: FAD-dependent oxidoreductase [Candidatus Abyssubacteria bacterium]
MLSRRKFLVALGAGTGVLLAPGLTGMLAEEKGVETDDPRRESLWTLECPTLPSFPAFEGDREVDLAIVGAGYTGLSCAYYAKKFRPGWSVVVLESHRLGSGASSRNSGAVYASYHGIDDKDMARRGLERLTRFIETEAIECDFRPCPTIQIFASDSAARKAHASLPPGARWVSAEELSENIHTGYYSGAMDLPEYFAVHPAKLIAGHVKAAHSIGAELYELSPVMEVKKGIPAELVTPKGRLRATNVLIATNAYTPRLGLLRTFMMPVHQFTLTTRKLTDDEMKEHGLDRWPMRFERSVLPVTNFMTPTGHFAIRIVLGYATFNSCVWPNMDDARALAQKMFEQRYPWIADIGFERGWHGVTGHTLKVREIAGPAITENIYASVAYNGLGVMPGHNNGYLSACSIVNHLEPDIQYLSGVRGHIRFPGEYYRSLVFTPFMKLMTPD